MNSCCPNFSPEKGCEHWPPEPVEDPYVQRTPMTQAEKAEFFRLAEEKWDRSRTGERRVDIDGVEWTLTDPYPTWFRMENGAIIVGNPTFLEGT